MVFAQPHWREITRLQARNGDRRGEPDGGDGGYVTHSAAPQPPPWVTAAAISGGPAKIPTLEICTIRP